MGKESLKVSALLPATPREVFDAWLDSAAHSKMTGAPASIDPTVGGRHTAWGGYIQGTNLELEPDRLIVQRWRTEQFPADADDSLLELHIEPAPGGTRVTIVHTEIPEGQGRSYESGWHQHYFEPMDAYFSARVHDEDIEPAPETLPYEAVSDARAPRSASGSAAVARAPAAIAAKPAAKKRAAAARPAAKQAKPGKAAAKKAAAKKAPAKKAAAKKAPAKKAAAKKAPAKKAAAGKKARKVAPKRAAKPATGRGGAATRKAGKKATKKRRGARRTK